MKEYTFTIYCSNCQEALLDVVVYPNDTTTRIRASCPHCGDKSYWKDIKGKFGLSYTQKTEPGKIDYEGNIVEVTCHKR